MKTKELLLSHDELIKILDYNQETGIFIWKHEQKNGQIKANSIAGSIHKKTGYIRIGINNMKYLAHRLAWFYVTGNWPIMTVDHIDTIKHHNWFINLREATMSEQGCNIKLRSDNTSGTKGVVWNKRVQKWIVRICINNECINLGYFIDLDEAIETINKARENYHKEFSNYG